MNDHAVHDCRGCIVSVRKQASVFSKFYRCVGYVVGVEMCHCCH